MALNDLSRLAEDLVLYSSAEFGLVRLADPWTTGSSLMPQKRNPDGAELTRAAGGVALGLLTGLLATLKGLPAGYQKDLQEDKRALFEASDRMMGVLEVLGGSIGSMRIERERAAERIDPSVLASDVAEHLAARGVPFREAHDAVARLVRRADELGVALPDLPSDEVDAIAPQAGESWNALFDVERGLERRRSDGGSSLASVRAQTEAARERLGGS